MSNLPRKPRRVTPLPTRFWSKVEKADGCWWWTAGVDGRGYGLISSGRRTGKYLRAHRLSYEMNVGPIPEGMNICHRCDNRRCVRPEHLFLGTQSDNLRDMVDKGRHFSHANPEKLARGDRNGARVHPEKMARGEEHYRAKLTEQQAKEALKEARNGVPYRTIAEKHGVALPTISALVRGTSWAHLSGERGRKQGRLTEEQAMSALQQVKRGRSQKSIAEECGVHFATISALVRGKSWKHLPRD